MSSVLIAVDVQKDFLPGGALAVPQGDSVIPELEQLAKEVDFVIASRDWHPPDHFSFSALPGYIDGSWPAHCVQHTAGARIHPRILKIANYIVSKGMDPTPPDAYSAFAGGTLRPAMGLEKLLTEAGVDEIVVGGLALDYCVKHTALDANALGWRTLVPVVASRGVEYTTSARAIGELSRAGVIIA